MEPSPEKTAVKKRDLEWIAAIVFFVVAIVAMVIAYNIGFDTGHAAGVAEQREACLIAKPWGG